MRSHHQKQQRNTKQVPSDHRDLDNMLLRLRGGAAVDFEQLVSGFGPECYTAVCVLGDLSCEFAYRTAGSQK